MLKLVGSIVVSIALMCGATSTASAQSTQAPAGPGAVASDKLAGPFRGTHHYELRVKGCLIYEEFVLTSLGDGGRSQTVSISGCVDGPQGDFEFTFRGSFVLTARNGATLTGTVTGDVRPLSAGATLALTLHVDHGTRQLRNLTGDIGVTSFDFFPETTALTGTIDPMLIRSL